MKSADAKNESALTTNATLRPATRGDEAADRRAEGEHRRPRRARQARWPAAALRRDVTLGIVAVRAGSKNAVRRDGQRHHHVRDPHLVARAGRAAGRGSGTPRRRSATIISRRRLTRSTTTPASGPTIATGRNCTIIIQATAVADPVRSSSSAYTATALNQSPSCEMVWPM